MKVPVSWLYQHLQTSGYSLEEIAERLTIGGIEVEVIEAIGAQNKASVAGVIVEGEIVKEGLRRLSVDVGTDKPATIVTRSVNLQTAPDGTRIAVALPGAEVFTQDDDGLFGSVNVKKREIAGILSEGVGCSELELGVGENNSEVLVLDSSIAAGTPLKDVFKVEEYNQFGADDIMDLAILPNIARCQSILGVARETGALLDIDVQLDVELADIDVTPSDINPLSSDPQLCSRFAVALIEGVQVSTSPDFIQRRLVASGVAPVNNIVDATNYVMIEMGQPSHAYDADLLPSLELSVRKSRDGEKFMPLGSEPDAEAMALSEGLPVIVSEDTPVALAGVIGGHDTRVNDATTRILLESANFDYIAIRRSQAAALTFTEASARFSRGVDSALVPLAIRRIVAILRLSCPDLVVAKTGIFGTEAPDNRLIPLKVAELNDFLGTSLDTATVVKQLQRVGLASEELETGCLQVSVPSSRDDITIPCDLMEEVARLHGFDRMPETMPVEPVPLRLQDRFLQFRFDIVDQLASSGLQEIISYTLSSPEREAKLYAGREEKSDPFVELQNPLTVDRRAMRRRLLPNLLDCLQANLRHENACHLFELGVVVHPEQQGKSEGLPGESNYLGVVMCGVECDSDLYNSKPREVDFFDLRGVITDMADHFHLSAVEFIADDVAPFHPGICARMVCNGQVLGWMGELHPLVADAYDLSGKKVYAAELNVDVLWQQMPNTFLAEEPPRFPYIEIDLSLLVPEEVTAQQVLDSIQSSAQGLLRDLQVFDLYSGENVTDNFKAIGLRLQLGDESRTLEMVEAETLRDKMVAVLESELGVSLRG